MVVTRGQFKSLPCYWFVLFVFRRKERFHPGNCEKRATVVTKSRAETSGGSKARQEKGRKKEDVG